MKMNLNGNLTELKTAGLEVINGSFVGKYENGNVVFETHSMPLGDIINNFLFINGFDKFTQLMECDVISSYVLGQIEEVKPNINATEDVVPLYQSTFTVEAITKSKYVAENNEFFILYDMFGGMIVVDKKLNRTSSLNSANVVLVRGKTIRELISKVEKTAHIGSADVYTNIAPGIPSIVVIENDSILSGDSLTSLSPAPFDLDGNKVLQGGQKSWVESLGVKSEEPKTEIKTEPKEGSHLFESKQEPKKEVADKVSVLDTKWKEVVALGYRGTIDEFRNDYATHVASFGSFDKDKFFNNYTKRLLDAATEEEFTLVGELLGLDLESFKKKKDEFMNTHENWDLEKFMDIVNKSKQEEIKEEIKEVNAPTTVVSTWGSPSSSDTTASWGGAPIDNKGTGDNTETPSWGGFGSNELIDLASVGK